MYGCGGAGVVRFFNSWVWWGQALGVGGSGGTGTNPVPTRLAKVVENTCLLSTPLPTNLRVDSQNHPKTCAHLVCPSHHVLLQFDIVVFICFRAKRCCVGFQIGLDEVFYSQRSDSAREIQEILGNCFAFCSFCMDFVHLATSQPKIWVQESLLTGNRSFQEFLWQVSSGGRCPCGMTV